MAKQHTITKLIRTGNIFVDEYDIWDGKSKRTVDISGVWNFITKSASHSEIYTNGMGIDIMAYGKYLREKKKADNIRDNHERAKRLAWLEVEVGTYPINPTRP